MKWLLGLVGAVGAIGMALGAGAGGSSAQETARVRIVHASPDAPAVDVYADGAKVLTAVPYKGSSGYLAVPAGLRNFQVFATGANPAADTAVIDADATLASGKDYTVIAAGRLADINPVVLEDNNAAPAEGKAHVRVVHASPDAPAVDIAVKDGPVIFPGLAFPAAAGPSPVDAGSYDLEVRAAGTTTVALALDGVQLDAGKVYTVLAVGLLNGEPALEALPLVNDPVAAPQPMAPAPGVTGQLPAAGTGSTDAAGWSWPLMAALAVAGLALAGAGAVTTVRGRTR